MPSKHIRGKSPITVTGGGGTTTVDAFTDTFTLQMNLTDSNAVPSDVDAYQITLAQADTNADLSETLQLQFPTPDFSDTEDAPTDVNSFTARVWLSASAGGTNPTNADGVNNATVATLQTAAAGASTITLTSTLGANVPSGINVASAIYRGWFKSVNTLTTSTGSLILHSTSALFADKTMFSNAALNTTVDKLDGSFTYDLVANGVDTFTKIASAQMLHRVVDAVAGITPHVLTVDAGCIELAAAFSGGAAGGSQSFGYTGAEVTFVVPAGVTTISVDMAGGQGGLGGALGNVGTPAGGGRVQASLTTTPGETLYVGVGGRGNNGNVARARTFYDASQSGGTAGGDGGGQTYIKRGGTADSNRVLVAGGSGGCGNVAGTAVPVGNGGYALDTEATGATSATNATNNGAGGGGGGWRGGVGPSTQAHGPGGTNMAHSTQTTGVTSTANYNTGGTGYVSLTW